MNMGRHRFLVFVVGLFVGLSAASAAPLRILLATGGCWHNYTTHANSLRAAFVRANVPIKWQVASLPCTDSDGKVAALDKVGWTDSADVVFFNGCYGSKDSANIRNIVRGFKSDTALVALHCAMHSFRAAPTAAKEEWYRLLGVTSQRHEMYSEGYALRVLTTTSSIMAPYKSAVYHGMPRDELYVIDKVWPRTRVMGYSRSLVSCKEYPMFWTNSYLPRGTRVFGTTFGHSDEAWASNKLTDTVVRGTLWAAGRL